MINTKELAELFIRFGNELNELSIQQAVSENEKNKEKLLTEKEVIEKYSFFNKTSLYRAVNYRGLKSYKINSHRFYKVSDIEEWIESQSVETPKPFVGF